MKSEESAKAAKLVAAIVVVFGCAAWRVAGAVAPASTSAPAPAVAVETPASVATAPATPKEELIVLPKGAAVTNVDPFRTIKGEADPAAAIPTPPTLAGAPTVVAPTGPLSVAPLPTAQIGGALVAGSAPLAPREPQAPVQTIHLSGTLAGPNATAVLEIGGTSQVVRVGTRLEDGSVVVAIDPATVTIKRQGKIRILDVGE